MKTYSTTGALQVSDISAIPKSLLTEQGDMIYASAVATPAVLAHGSVDDLIVDGGHGANPTKKNIRDLWVRGMNQLLYKSWEDTTGFTDHTTGSGSIEKDWTMLGLMTGTTNPSIASVYSPSVVTLDTSASANNTRMTAWFTPVAAAFTNLTIWVGLFETPAAPVTTDRHVAFWVSNNADLYASNSDGTQTSTDTTVNLANTIIVGLHFYASQSNIKFYTTSDGVTWTLRATHTTHMPSGELYQLFYLATSSTTGKELWIPPILIQQGN